MAVDCYVEGVRGGAPMTRLRLAWWDGFHGLAMCGVDRYSLVLAWKAGKRARLRLGFSRRDRR